MSKRIDVIRRYFEAQNRSDADAVVRLFSDDAVVVNAAFPPVTGHDGLKGFAGGLYTRTSARQFVTLKIFENNDDAAAEWEVEMTFRAGAVIGPHTLSKPFTVRLRGVNVFEFKKNSEVITKMSVYHETSTVARLAAEHATKS